MSIVNYADHNHSGFREIINQNNSAKILGSSISPFPDKVIQDEPKGARQSVHEDSNINILYLLVIFNAPLLQWFIII